MKIVSTLRLWAAKSQCSSLHPPLRIILRNSHTITSIDEHLNPNVKSHPWTEWPRLVTNLKLKGYFDRPSSEQLLRAELIPDDLRLCPKFFHQAASACLFFANEHPHLIEKLSRKDIVDVFRFGIPGMFQDHNTVRRMKLFVQGDQNNEVKDVEFITKGLSPVQIIIHYGWIQNKYQDERGGILQMSQVVRNAVCNAMYAAPRGSDVTDEEKERPSSNYQSALRELANVLGEDDKAHEEGLKQWI